MTDKPPKRRRSAWFAFYPDDFAGGTRGMSLASKGAFIDLLAYQFANGSIPKDDRTLCRIVGAFPDEWEEIRGEVLSKFEEDGGALVNRRMQKERDERNEIREKRIEAVSKRWNKSDTNVSDLNKQTGYKSNDFVDTSPSPSPSPSTTKSSTKTKEENPLTPKGELPFPSDFSEERKESFKLWLKYKKEKGQNYKPTGWETMLAKFAHLSDSDLDASIRNSMANNYSGIFEVKGQAVDNPIPPKPNRRKLPENWRDIAQEIYGHPLTCPEDELTPSQYADIYRQSRS
jgi:uncharacterized protein YdaU (DUF1376 family)